MNNTCLCGCGLETGVYLVTDTRRGNVKGQPRRFLPGHALNRNVGARGKHQTHLPCSRCKKILSVECFLWSPSKNKYYSYCRDCGTERSRVIRLEKVYGINKENIQQLLKKQQNCCAICLQKFDRNRKSLNYHIDHNHRTGKVRGLLCQNCNTGLGLLQDDTKILAKALQYLMEHP